MLHIAMCSYSEWGALKESGNIKKKIKAWVIEFKSKKKKGKRPVWIAVHKEGEKITKDRSNKQGPM